VKKKQPFTSDLGSRIGAHRQNAEALLLYLEPVILVLQENKETNKRAASLLDRLQANSEVILETSIQVLIWSAFAGPILRKSEEKKSTIAEIRDLMQKCDSQTTKILSSDSPYDCLLEIADARKTKSTDYYR
jgi:hypothetical protein